MTRIDGAANKLGPGEIEGVARSQDRNLEAPGPTAANDRLRAWCNRVGAGETAPAANVLSTEQEIAKLKHVISALIPWCASSGRGMAQEALADACEAIGADPFMWSGHPDVLIRRRPDLDRRSVPRG